MFSRILVATVAAASALLTGCGGGSEVDVEADPTPLASLEAKYGPAERHAVTFYEPEGRSKGLVVWIHGGGWLFGDKGDNAVTLSGLPPRGYAVLSMNYRLEAEGAFPNSVEDVKRVLKTLDGGACVDCSNPELWSRAQKYAKESGVFVTGTSAGGYLAVYGGAEYVQKEPTSSVKCIGGMVFPPDFRDIPAFDPGVVDWLLLPYTSGDFSLANLERMSPAYQVLSGAWDNALSRKWSFLYSTTDFFIPFSTTAEMSQLLREKGAEVMHTNFESIEEEGGHKVPETSIAYNLYAATEGCFSPR